MLGSAFAFKPGDSLSQFMIPDAMSPALPDVHGNQTQLLAMSKCFQMSSMDCNTCHNTHIRDRGDKAAYAQRCQTCHNVAAHNTCGMAGSLDSSFLSTNCTQCHMPALPSRAIRVQTSGSGLMTACLVVSHRIAIYDQQSKKIGEQAKLKDHD